MIARLGWRVASNVDGSGRSARRGFSRSTRRDLVQEWVIVGVMRGKVWFGN